jgi:hypothetical protein
MAVTQIPAEPPNAGRIAFVITGWMEKRSRELQAMVMEYTRRPRAGFTRA